MPLSPDDVTLALDMSTLSPECAIAIANALSVDIDRLAECSDSLTQSDYDRTHAHIASAFRVACNVIESHGLVLSDVVVCPEYL